MSISKSIIIKEWMTDKNITAETLTTDEVGGGSLLWVPWEARGHVGELTVTHNGEYLAADDGLFGWTKVNVMVAGGNDAELEITDEDGTVHSEWVEAPASTIADDIGYGSGAVRGWFGGVEYVVTLDQEGYLVWTPVEDGGDDRVWIDQDLLDAINEAIQSKTGSLTDYTPAQMPAAIRGISVDTMSVADDGKVVQGGTLVNQSTIRITQNGTYDTTTKSEAVVTVSGGMELDSTDAGKVVVSGSGGYELAAQTSRSVSANGTYDTTTNNQVAVNVSNSYASSDEGKVVSSGALVSQTSLNVTENGTYDTTENNEVIVYVAPSAGLSSGDVGKVVVESGSGYTLSAQTSKNITANGTYDTTANSQVVVSVSGSASPSLLTSSNQQNVLDSLLYSDYDEGDGTWGNAIVRYPNFVHLAWDGLHMANGSGLSPVSYDVSSLTAFTVYAVLRETEVSGLGGPTSSCSLLKVDGAYNNDPQFYTAGDSWYTRQITGRAGDSIPAYPSQLMAVAIAIDASQDHVTFYWSEIRMVGNPIHSRSEAYSDVPNSIDLCYQANPVYGYLGVVSGVESDATIRANVQELMDYFGVD